MHYCGYQNGLCHDPNRQNWQQTGNRPIAWSAWFPTSETPKINAQTDQFFDLGDIATDALPSGSHKLPVVLLSHGTGGTAESLGWLARSLALDRYLVIAANHHGNSGIEPYRAEGFLCWWERAADMSVLLDHLNADGPFQDRLDLDRVSAVGFSLGGYAVLSLAGAVTALDEFERWQAQSGITMGGPREFPDAADQIPHLMQTSSAFQNSMKNHGKSYLDTRVRAIVAIAPAPTVRALSESSVCNISLPTTILTGGADQEAPNEHCVDWLTSINPRFQHTDMGPNVGHYTFLGFPADRTLIGKEPIFTDHPSVDREKLHSQVSRLVRAAIETAP